MDTYDPLLFEFMYTELLDSKSRFYQLLQQLSLSLLTSSADYECFPSSWKWEAKGEDVGSLNFLRLLRRKGWL